MAFKLPRSGSTRGGKIRTPKGGGKMAKMPKIKVMSNIFGLAPKTKMRIK